jgi:hypothetical protein
MTRDRPEMSNDGTRPAFNSGRDEYFPARLSSQVDPFNYSSGRYRIYLSAIGGLEKSEHRQLDSQCLHFDIGSAAALKISTNCER